MKKDKTSVWFIKKKNKIYKHKQTEDFIKSFEI